MDDRLTSDTLRGRTGESRIAHWILLDAHRWLLAGLLALAAFVGFGAVALPLREAMEQGTPVDTAFQALIAATLTGVTLVVAINQLVLSQELGRLGDQQTWMNGAMAYRRSAEELFGSIGPPDPSQFLQALVQTSSGRAEALQEAVSDTDDDALRRRTDRLVENAGLPGVVAATATVLYLDPESVPGATLGVDNVVWVVSASATITLVPFFLLAAYVLRIATVSKRTGSLGPFILRQAERTAAIDWDE